MLKIICRSLGKKIIGARLARNHRSLAWQNIYRELTENENENSFVASHRSLAWQNIIGRSLGKTFIVSSQKMKMKMNLLQAIGRSLGKISSVAHLTKKSSVARLAKKLLALAWQKIIGARLAKNHRSLT